jgi:hypothetical protein
VKDEVASAIFIGLGIGILIPGLYLLGIGPLDFMYERRWISLETVCTVNGPANWARDRGLLSVFGVGRSLDAYYVWWANKGHTARPNPQSGANGKQPFSPETNSTAAAAASRRSP